MPFSAIGVSVALFPFLLPPTIASPERAPHHHHHKPSGEVTSSSSSEFLPRAPFSLQFYAEDPHPAFQDRRFRKRLRFIPCPAHASASFPGLPSSQECQRLRSFCFWPPSSIHMRSFRSPRSLFSYWKVLGVSVASGSSIIIVPDDVAFSK